MPWYIITLSGLVGTGILSFWGWVAIQIVKQSAKLLELESKINNQEHTCVQRLDWIRLMDEKLDKVSNGISRIQGILEK